MKREGNGCKQPQNQQHDHRKTQLCNKAAGSESSAAGFALEFKRS